MKLDRNLQRRILQSLADAYPGSTADAWNKIQHSTDESSLIGNMLYLEEHGLISSGIHKYLSGDFAINTGALKITARGLDFLEDDGGLSAVLGVVTIRIHDDQLLAMLKSRIQESDVPTEEKRKSLDLLREIPADATKHLFRKLLDAGLDRWPEVLAAMQTFVP